MDGASPLDLELFFNTPPGAGEGVALFFEQLLEPQYYVEILLSEYLLSGRRLSGLQEIEFIFPFFDDRWIQPCDSAYLFEFIDELGCLFFSLYHGANSRTRSTTNPGAPMGQGSRIDSSIH